MGLEFAHYRHRFEFGFHFSDYGVAFKPIVHLRGRYNRVKFIICYYIGC